MGRIIIFTGKGGVGKTSLAAAHARKSALGGKRTLLVSTDMAHNLSDIFQQKIGRTVTGVGEMLDVVELDPEDIMQKDFSDMMRAVKKLFQSPGMGNGMDAEELVMLPGMEELFSLLKLLEFYESGRYDRIIVDCAPTGETLSLLKFPELLSWYMEKFFPIGKVALRVLAPVSKHFFRIELPDRTAMTDIERFYLKLVQLQELLKDHEITTVRLVALPEKMVVEETKRSFMYLNLYGYLVDGLYINRILPPEAGNEFFEEWFRIQKAYIMELEETFDKIPVTKLPWYETDVCGMAAVDRICTEVLREEALFEVRNTSAGGQYEQDGEGYLFRLYLPEAKKDEIDLHRSGTDVIIKIGNFKRNIPLPDTLRHYEIVSAKMEESMLILRFEKEDRDGGK